MSETLKPQVLTSYSLYFVKMRKSYQEGKNAELRIYILSGKKPVEICE